MFIFFFVKKITLNRQKRIGNTASRKNYVTKYIYIKK